ncbi:MAG: hypothetical protein ACK4KT_02450 [Thermaurantimonas sp.]
MKAGEFHNSPESPRLIHALKELAAIHKAVISLGIRDLKVRYIHTYLGWGWLILPPVVLLLPALAFRFGFGVSVNAEEMMFWLTSLGGHIVSAGLMQQISPLWVNNKNFLLKIRLPILFMPVSRLVIVFPEWVMYSLVLIGFGLYSGFSMIEIVMHVLVFQWFVLYGFSVGLLLCALSSRIRDVIHAVPILVQVHLLLIVFYLLNGVDYRSFFVLKAFPPVLLIELLRSQVGDTDIFLALLYTLLLPVVAVLMYVKMSHNAIERI